MAESVNSQHPVMVVKLFQPLLQKMETILKTRGEKGLIEWCKNHRLALLHFWSGEFPLKQVSGVTVTKDGWPKVLGRELFSASTDSTLVKRLLLTCLFSTRAFAAGTKPDTRPITDPLSVADLPDIGEYATLFWRTLGYRPSQTMVPRGVYFRKFHMTSKAGPSKGSAIWGSMGDFGLILGNSTLVSDLLTLGGKKFERVFCTLKDNYHFVPKVINPSVGTTLRRLTSFPDKELKVRTVAILDYFSQTVLRAFHDYLFKVLRKIPQDCTFNQSKFLTLTKDWKEFYSIDLTAATDRFPIHIICIVLKGLLPSAYVDAWKRIMVDLPFDYNGVPLKYAVGNPMGAYSSWNSFAIAHHYIMYWCCKQLDIPWKLAKYALLGDDILIGDRRLAELYKATMKRLGVEISSIKTHDSSRLFEFAKRLVLDGTEITPFPISSLAESSKKFYLLVNLLQEESRKGWTWSNGIPLTVKSFYTTVLGLNRTYSAKIEERSFVSELTMQMIRGALPAQDGLNTIARRFCLLLPEINPSQGISILSGTALECFVDKNPLDYNVKGEPLGLLAANLVIEITGSQSDLIEKAPGDFLSSIPILAVYGQFEEEFLKVAKEAYLIDTIGKGEWPMHLRAMVLPLSDKVFSERASHTVSRVSAILGDRLLRNLSNLKPKDLS